MAKTQYLTYYIVLTDAAAVAAYQAQYPTGVNRAPYDPGPPEGGAAIEFAAPFLGYTEVSADQAPYIWTPWSGIGGQGGPFPLNVATFQRHSGGFLGIGGTTVRYYWIGQFVYAGTAAAPPGTPSPGEEPANGPALVLAPIARRIAIEGFEVPLGNATDINSTSFGSANGISCSRDASRHVGGFGLAIRGATATGTLTHNSWTSGFVNPRSWTFLYVRLRRLPDGTVQFWHTNGAPSSEAGISVGVTATGQLAVFNVNASAVQTLLATVGDLPVWDGTAQDHAFVRLDFLTEYNTAAALGFGTFRLYINKVLELTAIVPPASTGLGSNSQTAHVSSIIGTNAGTNNLEIDVDDWIISELPAGRAYSNLWSAGTAYIVDDYAIGTDDHVYKCILGHTNKPPSLTANGTYWVRYEGLDWLNGSKVGLVRPSAFGGTHGAWVGNVRILGQHGTSSAPTAIASLTSSTSGDVCAVTTDAERFIDADHQSIGVASMLVSALTAKGSVSGSLGYSLNGAAAVMTAIVESTSPTWLSVLYTLNGPSALADITPLQLRYIKGADSSAGTIKSLLAQVEMLGLFGPEDYAADSAPTFPAFVGQHNAPYRQSPYVLDALAAPNGPFMVVGGTYVGNGTGQDITFRAPVHLLFIRPLTSGGGGFMWSSTMAASHKAYQNGSSPLVVWAEEDPTFVPADGEDAQQQRYRIRIVGTDSQVNANGVTFQYIAVGDPAARFMLNGAMNRRSSLTSTGVDTLLVNPDFLPEWGFFFVESYDNTTTNRLYGKGIGNAAATLATIAGTALTSALTFLTGIIRTATNWHAVLGAQTAYCLFRRHDGNDDPGEPGVVALITWTGDGTASRTIGIAPASGKRPLFAMAFSEAATGYWRDPSHTTTNSTNATGSDQTTGITGGGIDSISVGSALNTNGVVYNMFVLFAGTTAGNGGWGTNGEYFPVESDSPTDGPWPPDPDPADFEPEPEPTPDVVENPDLDPDTALPGTELFCLEFSEQMVNKALSRLGVSIVVGDLATDTTQAAIMARLHLKADVEYVLSAFPWEFARKYATLVLVDGTLSDPVNGDWTYSYRRPTDCIFERRIVRSRGTAVNPTSPAFSLGKDASGGLIYTNETAAKLEYTARGLCPTYEGEPLFQEALIWKHVASLAPSLTRLSGKVTEALTALEATIAKAYDVQRTANPGPQAEADSTGFDQTAAAVAANLSTANRALIRIGARTVASLALSDQSREAIATRLIFEDELKATLRDFAWQFATRYAELALVAGAATWDDALVQTWDTDRTYEENDAVTVGGTVYYALRQTAGDAPASSPNDWTTDEPEEANGDWLRAYRVPTNTVRARRLVKQTARRVYDNDPTPFKLGTDDGGEILFTDAEQAVLEFTERIDNLLSRADPLFRDAFAWRLSASLAPSLAQIDPEELEQPGRGADATALAHKGPNVKANKAAQRQAVARFALARYYDVLETAKAGDANEGQAEPIGDAPWIEGR